MPRAMQVDRAMEMEGWKLLLLCRLSPLLPYNLINITVASTRIHLWPFAVVSFFGVAPTAAATTHCQHRCFMGPLCAAVAVHAAPKPAA